MGKPPKILIVDDNQDLLFTMETFLKRNGFDVLTADDGQKGLALIKESHPDLVLLDIMMETTFSGLDVCKAVRSDADLNDIPIIGISGIGDEMGIQIDKWGDDDYFSVDEFFEKPVDREKLLERIKVRLKKGVIKRGHPDL
ncbi:response regulator receiver domain protein [delta proteobacterium NaphS2]|nr:response regulator receiver domain protein [delta proteobacterium NaphS2]